MLKIILKSLVVICMLFTESIYSKETLVCKDGSYDTFPLEKDSVVIKLLQTSVEDAQNPETASKVITRNLNKVIKFIKKACTEGKKPDILLLHEFPLTGYIGGKRAEKLKSALKIPGPESDELAKLAKKYDTYIIFGSYAKDDSWPGHILSLTTVLGRDGSIVKKIWKPKNIKRFYSTFEITTTTIEGVRTKFREKYGIEDEFPVLRTEFGNIALTTTQLDPFVFAAYAMLGAEIILRTSTLFFPSDVVNMAMINNVYSAMANMPHPSKYGGNSMAVDPNGEIIAKLNSNTEEGIITAIIPIAKFRKGRRLPQFAVELTKNIISQYQDEIPANHLDLPVSKLPEDGREMKALLDNKSRWLNNY